MLQNASYMCIADIKCVRKFSDSKNCVASFGTAKKRLKLSESTEINFFVCNAVDVGKVCERHSKKFKNKSLASKYSV